MAKPHDAAMGTRSPTGQLVWTVFLLLAAGPLHQLPLVFAAGSANACTARVGLLQLSRAATSTELDAAAKTATANGANVLVVPQAFAANLSVAGAFGALARQLSVPVVGTYQYTSPGLGTGAALYSRSGELLLAYSKPRGTYDRPTAGANRTTVPLWLGEDCTVRTALLLDTDYLFPETVRALLSQDTELALLSTDWHLTPRDLDHLAVLATDNRLFLATANYAAGAAQGAASDQRMSSNGQSSLLSTFSCSNGRCLHIAGAASGPVIFEANITALRHPPCTRCAAELALGGDMTRKPYRYQHLCFDGPIQL